MKKIAHVLEGETHKIYLNGDLHAVVGKAVPGSIEMFRGLILMAETLEEELPSWGWSNGNLRVYGDCSALRLTEKEIEECATTSCGPRLWAYRAWCQKRGIDVRKADWFFYANEVTFKEDMERSEM